MASLWRSRRWRRLLNLIDGLGSDSALAEAQANDEEFADQVLESGPEPETRPRLSEFGPEVRALSNIYDRLGELMQAVVAASPNPGMKMPEPRPAPRPASAFDRAEERRVDRQFNELVAEIEAARSSE